MESLTEVFKCIICLSRLRDAHLCPFCSKMCCLVCMRRWLNHQSGCPHCRLPVKEEQFVRCRWADDVTDKLDDLQTTMSLNASKRESGDWCKEHDVTVSVYCRTCCTSVCHRCALFSPAHEGHEFEDLDRVYDNHVETISAQLSSLRDQQKKLLQDMQVVEHNVEVLRASREEMANRIVEHCETLLGSLDDQLRSKFMVLVNRKNRLSEQTRRLETVLHQVEEQLRSHAKSSLIENSRGLVRMFAEVADLPAEDLTPLLPDFRCDLFPEYSRGQVRIGRFLERAKGAALDDVAYSDTILCSGLAWRLKVYPSGIRGAHGTHVSVYIELVSGPPRSYCKERQFKYDWRIEMVGAEPSALSPGIAREHLACAIKPGESWGYERFARAETIEKEGLVAPDGSVCLRFSVRPVSARQLLDIKTWHIKVLEGHARLGHDAPAHPPARRSPSAVDRLTQSCPEHHRPDPVPAYLEASSRSSSRPSSRLEVLGPPGPDLPSPVPQPHEPHPRHEALAAAAEEGGDLQPHAARALFFSSEPPPVPASAALTPEPAWAKPEAPPGAVLRAPSPGVLELLQARVAAELAGVAAGPPAEGGFARALSEGEAPGPPVDALSGRSQRPWWASRAAGELAGEGASTSTPSVFSDPASIEVRSMASTDPA